MKNILFLSINGFKNDSRMTKQAITLSKAGYSVKIMTVHKETLNEYEKNEYFEVYRLKLSTKNMGKNKLIQLIKMFEFNKRVIEKLKDINFIPDIVQSFTSYPLNTAFKIKNKLNKDIKIIYDPREYVKAQNTSRFNRILILFLEKIYIKKVNSIITVGEYIAEFYKKDYSLKKKPILLRNIPFFYENKLKNNKLREKLNISLENKILLYQGALLKGRGLEKLIEVFSKLPSNLSLVFMGEGILKEKLKNKAKELGVDKRVYFTLVSNKELLEYTSSADIGIYLMENTCLNHYYALPNKLFEFVQGELPIICSNFPEMSKIVSKYNIGEVINPSNENEIIEKVIFLLNNLERYKENLKIAKKELCWENEENKLISLYKEVLL